MQKIAKKFVEVMRECSHVAKNGTNDFHRYKYATSADVIGKVNTALTKHGIASVVTPALLSIQEVTTAKGNTERLATVEVTVTLIDSESGESFAIKGLGSGQDAGDKALAKAQTMALKYCYMASLVIATGDDPEADSKTDDAMHFKPSLETPAQIDNSVTRTKNATKLVCHDCGSVISQKVADYSKAKFGRFLCLDCQRAKKSAA
ncbi:MAG: ERF family protein [Fibrobacter sp.]|uniref:ERF family protein n=1 Tax=Fibrobacter sp. TaxID=35828 RepID=UPI0025BF464A|nr:ERF family protein [Fibrobacter sp.]MBQ3443196.1 ERF family protein [Selenomonadaceae bacterium]MBQ7079904.1 ERF family protein [Fibrobacter sp.]